MSRGGPRPGLGESTGSWLASSNGKGRLASLRQKAGAKGGGRWENLGCGEAQPVVVLTPAYSPGPPWSAALLEDGALSAGS